MQDNELHTIEAGLTDAGVPQALRRRTPEERERYIAEKVPVIAKRFSVSEAEARSLLEGLGNPPVAPAPTPEEGSIRFVLTKLDDETLNFSIEFEGQGSEDVTTVTHDEYGRSGIDLIKDTVATIGEALGIEVVEL
jgi:hypothetical protein